MIVHLFFNFRCFFMLLTGLAMVMPTYAFPFPSLQMHAHLAPRSQHNHRHHHPHPGVSHKHGKATWYRQDDRPGSCGKRHKDSDYIVALPQWCASAV